MILKVIIISGGVEPTVNRALIFAKGEGFLEDLYGEFSLTEKGQGFFKVLKKNNDLFQLEKSFLEEVGKMELQNNELKN